MVVRRRARHALLETVEELLVALVPLHRVIRNQMARLAHQVEALGVIHKYDVRTGVQRHEVPHVGDDVRINLGVVGAVVVEEDVVGDGVV